MAAGSGPADLGCCLERPLVSPPRHLGGWRSLQPDPRPRSSPGCQRHWLPALRGSPRLAPCIDHWVSGRPAEGQAVILACPGPGAKDSLRVGLGQAPAVRPVDCSFLPTPFLLKLNLLLKSGMERGENKRRNTAFIIILRKLSVIFLTSNLPAMLFRTDLPINYRDEKSSGKRKRELIRSLAGDSLTLALSHMHALCTWRCQPSC